MIGTRVPVLDKGWIELQDLMGDDNAIVSAARTSFPRSSMVAVPMPKSGGMGSAPLRDEELIGYLMVLLTQMTRTV